MAQPFSRILLATEHSEYDRGSEALAFALARHCGQALAGVLPIMSNAEFEAVAPQVAARDDAAAARQREALAAAASAAGVELDLTVRHGPELYAEIVDEARARASELIVIRRRGRRGLLANLLLGEMVHKVVAHAPCSVLIVPRAAPMWSSRVLAAVDPATNELHPAILGAAVARTCGVPLTVAAVATGPTLTDDAVAARVLEGAVRAARDVGVEAEALKLVGKVHVQLIDAAARCAADLLVVGRHGDTALARAWIGGVTQKVIGLAECPVLVSIPTSRSPQ
jgi:nucleotide-binding universal stress UspA family protein